MGDEPQTGMDPHQRCLRINLT